jgi:hypothetical protein
MQVVLCLLLLLGLLLPVGCARDRGRSASTTSRAPSSAGSTNATFIVTPDQALNGKVSWVNANLRFVVITFPVGQMPVSDQSLNVYREGLKVGEVKISGPQSDDSIVADITAGEAAVGDAIRSK